MIAEDADVLDFDFDDVARHHGFGVAGRARIDDVALVQGDVLADVADDLGNVEGDRPVLSPMTGWQVTMDFAGSDTFGAACHLRRVAGQIERKGTADHLSGGTPSPIPVKRRFDVPVPYGESIPVER